MDTFQADDAMVDRALNVKRQREKTRRETLNGAVLVFIGLLLEAAAFAWMAAWDGVSNGDSWMPLIVAFAFPVGVGLAVLGISKVNEAA